MSQSYFVDHKVRFLHYDNTYDRFSLVSSYTDLSRLLFENVGYMLWKSVYRLITLQSLRIAPLCDENGRETDLVMDWRLFNWFHTLLIEFVHLSLNSAWRD